MSATDRGLTSAPQAVPHYTPGTCPAIETDSWLEKFHGKTIAHKARAAARVDIVVVLARGRHRVESPGTSTAKGTSIRAAFSNFVPEVVAEFDDEDVTRLLADRGIIRNRAKILATIKNAAATIALRSEGGLVDFIWSYQPKKTPIPRTVAEVPTTSDESIALSKALRGKGFSFVGPTTMHALMEATGMVDTHLVGSHRRGSSGVWPCV